MGLISSLRNAQRDVSLSTYSWWKIGGKTDHFIEVTSQSQLKSAILDLKSTSLPFCIIGQGTNLLFDDAGYRGCVIRIGSGLSGLERNGDKITVESGCWVPQLALFSARNGLSGLEHAIGIPASFGGLVCMNGGSQRKNIGELIESVTVFTPEGNLRTDLASECGFGYRKSRYQASGDIILSATLRFERSRPYEEQRVEMLQILRERSRKFPRKMPSCGSVFKSSPELYEAYGPPGMIIEDLGFKGQVRGRIQVSPAHSNFIVNLGGGSSRDVLALVREIHATVLAKTGISMQPEFLYVDPVCGPQEVV